MRNTYCITVPVTDTSLERSNIACEWCDNAGDTMPSAIAPASNPVNVTFFAIVTPVYSKKRGPRLCVTLARPSGGIRHEKFDTRHDARGRLSGGPRVRRWP